MKARKKKQVSDQPAALPPPAESDTAAAAPPSVPAPPPGLPCPKCGCPEMFVVYTAPRWRVIMRRRECRHCGHRITTTERPQFAA